MIDNFIKLVLLLPDKHLEARVLELHYLTESLLFRLGLNHFSEEMSQMNIGAKFFLNFN